MDEGLSAEIIRDKGYALLPKAHQNSPGYTGLVISLREQPVGHRFDPVSLRLRLRDEESGICRASTLKHSNSCRAIRHVCPGNVTLIDTSDSGRSFFTFGGDLKCTSSGNDFVYELTSEAPILDLRGSIESIPDQLAAKTEAKIAEIEAKWEPDGEDFSIRLGQIDPFTLYVSAIETILIEYHKNKFLPDVFRKFSDALHWERGWLQDKKMWPEEVNTVDDLLGKP